MNKKGRPLAVGMSDRQLAYVVNGALASGTAREKIGDYLASRFGQRMSWPGIVKRLRRGGYRLERSDLAHWVLCADTEPKEG